MTAAVCVCATARNNQSCAAPAAATATVNSSRILIRHGANPLTQTSHAALVFGLMNNCCHYIYAWASAYSLYTTLLLFLLEGVKKFTKNAKTNR